MRQYFAILIALSFSLLLSGCEHYLDNMGLRDETVYPAAYPIDNPAPPKRNGTIYQSGHEITLYQDRMANRIGDILTVRLEETTQGEKKARTRANKIASNSITIPGIRQGGIQGHVVNTASNQQFNGDGESNEQNKLRGTVSVTVIRVLSNGNLVIQGESWLTINQGREYIRLTGIVRPDDIEPNNMISSQRVADARIAYSGNGQVSNVSRGGVLTQLMNKFFPY
jgi:flagellar L-ring protein precursor FlgH